MRQVHKQLPALTYVRADARCLPYACSAFDGAFEKGLLDTILCGGGSTDNAALVLGEAHRVLKPGAALVVVSYGEPACRLSHFEAKAWDVDVYILSRPPSSLD